jgi:antitoxin YefM
MAIGRDYIASIRLYSMAILKSYTLKSMASEITFTRLRENLASILDEVEDQHKIVIVRRSGSRDVALVPASELAGLTETAYLLRSPTNARRLMTALNRASLAKGKVSGVGLESFAHKPHRILFYRGKGSVPNPSI